MSNEVTTATATYVVRVGAGKHTHIANADGNTECGSQGARRGGRRKSSTSFLPAGTEVTCTKCNADAPAGPPVEAPAPAAVNCGTCGYRIPSSNHGVCLICN